MDQINNETHKTPTHIAYIVKKGAKKNYWTKIGAAWMHKDGGGFNVQLDCFPKDGNFTLRQPSEAESEEA